MLPKTLLSLIHAFEMSADMHISDNGQKINGITDQKASQLIDGPGGAQIDNMLKLVGYAKTYNVLLDDEQVDVPLFVEEKKPHMVSFYCPKTFRCKPLPRHNVALYQVDETRFLHSLADLLDIPNADRSGISSPQIPRKLWCLGSAKLDQGFYAAIFIGRAIGSQLNAFLTALASKKVQGILLCTSNVIPENIHWPEGISICRLTDIVLSHLPYTTLDKDALYRMASGQQTPQAAFDSICPVQFDPIQKALRVQGKPAWFIKGPKQQKAVQFMVEQARCNRWELRASEILNATRSLGQSGGSSRMSSLFSHSLEWQDYIFSPRKGYYSIKIK